MVQGTGPSKPKYMLIGEAPGYNEDLVGEPFIGAAGKQLDEMLALAGLKRGDIYITNSVKCRPPNNAKPTKSHISICNRWLMIEVNELDPELIVVMGDTAMKSLGIGESVSVCHGKLLTIGARKVVVMYHPAYALHNPAIKSVMEEDWRRLPRLHETVAPTPNLKHHAPISGDVIALDTETVDLEDQTMVCWSAANEYQAGSYSAKEIKTIFQEEQEKRLFLGHNLKYDLPVFKANGLDLYRSRLEDTQVLAYLLRMPTLKLKELVLLLFGVKSPDAGALLRDVDNQRASERARALELGVPTKAALEATQRVLASPDKAAAIFRRTKSLTTLGPLSQASMVDIPHNILADYSAKDAFYTFEVWKALRKQLPKDQEALYQIECKLVPILSKMEQAGMLVSREGLMALKDQLEALLAIRRGSLAKLGLENPRSVEQKRKLFETQLDKLEHPKLTSTHQLSVGKGQLEMLKPTVLRNKVLGFSRAEKVRTFVQSLLDAQKDDGRIHGSFNQTVAETGRLSSSNPNLQNIPVRSLWAHKLRDLFIAMPEHKLVAVDLSQIELRILAHFTQDPTLLDAYRTNKDLHLITAMRLWPDYYSLPLSVQEVRRKLAKNINFTMVYEGSAYTLTLRYGVPKTEAEQLIEDYYRAYPGIADYQQAQHAMARRVGYTETLFHRRRYFPDIRSNDRAKRTAAERACGNHPIQGTAADLMKMIMVDVDDWTNGLPTRMIAQEHDELLNETHESALAEVCSILVWAAELDRGLSVPMKCDIEIGNRWSELH